jgi:integrase/recombinase XerD
LITTLPIRKKNTVRAYRWIINKFCADFGEEELARLSSEKVLQFFNVVTDGCKPQTKRVRFTHLSSFFSFMKNNIDTDFQNLCELPMLRKLFRPTVTVRWNIIEKETVDEIIFRTTNVRNRFILELMARGGMRIPEITYMHWEADLRKRVDYMFPLQWCPGRRYTPCETGSNFPDLRK